MFAPGLPRVFTGPYGGREKLDIGGGKARIAAFVETLFVVIKRREARITIYGRQRQISFQPSFTVLLPIALLL